MSPASIVVKSRRVALWLLALSLLAPPLLSSCAGNNVTPWNSMIGKSLDTPPAPPAAQPGDPYPSTCTTYAMHNSVGMYEQVDVNCYLHAELGAVWKAIQDPDLTKDSRTVDYLVMNVPDSNPQRPIHQIIHYDLMDLIAISYDLEWIHFLDQGTVAAPTHVVVTWQKIDGTSYITLLVTSFELTTPAPGITELVICEHTSAYSTGVSDVRAAVLGYYTNIAKYLGVPATP